MESGNRELDLIRRAGAGDLAALTVLLKQSRRRLKDLISRKIPGDLQGTTDAEDIVQETHVEVFRIVSTFEPRGPYSFYAWLARIAVRKLNDALKRQRAEKRGGGRAMTAMPARNIEDSYVGLLDLAAAPGRTPSGCVAVGEAVRAVQTALATLPQHYQQAMGMVYIQGCSVAAAATAMGRTERAIHGLCRRGLLLLRERLISGSRFLSSSG